MSKRNKRPRSAHAAPTTRVPWPSDMPVRGRPATGGCYKHGHSIACDCLRVVAAAIMDRDGRVWSVPKPGRHHDVMHVMSECGLPWPVDLGGTQGFLLSDGKFCRRAMAAYLAIVCGQIEKTAWGDELYSEDVW